MKDGFDSDDDQRAAVTQRHPKAGAASIAAMIKNQFADRTATKKRLAEMTCNAGSPIAVGVCHRWYDRFVAW